MKYFFFIPLFALLFAPVLHGQVGIGTIHPDPSAILEIKSNHQGFLPPTLTQSQIDILSANGAANGLIVYNTDSNCLAINLGNPAQSDWTCLGKTPPAPPEPPAPAGPQPLPPNITLASAAPLIIPSVMDNDYAPFTPQTTAATTATNQPGGGGTEPLIDFQGTLTTTGYAIPIRFQKTGALPVSLLAYSDTISVPSNLTSDGIARDVVFSYPTQPNITASSGEIEATIQSIGGPLNLKQLDIQTGIGNNSLGILLGQFQYATNSTGNTATLDFRTIAGIPDKNFADPRHRFIYLPILGEDGEIWLNNNLGANYSNSNRTDVFDIAQQATASNDQHAYGNLFQWGRDGDGHELINWISGSEGENVNGYSAGAQDNPTHGQYVGGMQHSGFFDWRVTPDATRWNTASSPHNPCPTGFKVPSNTEFFNYVDIATGITTDAERPKPNPSFPGQTDQIFAGEALASDLKLPTAGYQNGVGSASVWVFREGQHGWYWTSSISAMSQSTVRFTYSGDPGIPSSRGQGNSIRCLKE